MMQAPVTEDQRDRITAIVASQLHRFREIFESHGMDFDAVLRHEMRTNLITETR